MGVQLLSDLAGCYLCQVLCLRGDTAAVRLGPLDGPQQPWKLRPWPPCGGHPPGAAAGGDVQGGQWRLDVSQRETGDDPHWRSSLEILTGSAGPAVRQKVISEVTLSDGLVGSALSGRASL